MPFEYILRYLHSLFCSKSPNREIEMHNVQLQDTKQIVDTRLFNLSLGYFFTLPTNDSSENNEKQRSNEVVSIVKAGRAPQGENEVSGREGRFFANCYFIPWTMSPLDSTRSSFRLELTTGEFCFPNRECCPTGWWLRTGARHSFRASRNSQQFRSFIWRVLDCLRMLLCPRRECSHANETYV